MSCGRARPVHDDAGFTVREAGDDPPQTAAGAGWPKKPPAPHRRDKLALLLNGAALWRFPDGAAHASVPYGEHREHLRVQSRDFHIWVQA